MIRLIVNNESLDLNESTSIDLELSSIMQDFKLKGSFSLPFQLPTTPHNLMVLGFYNVLAVIDNKNKTYTATLFDDSLLVAEGNLKIRSGSRNYLDCDITIPPGNIPIYFWQTKMNEMDWGFETLDSKKYTPDVWATPVQSNEVGYFGVVSSQTQIYNYNVIINGSQIFNMQNVVSVEADAKLKVRCEELTGVFNTASLPYKIRCTDDGISIEGTGITTARIDVVITGTLPQTKSWLLTQLSEVDVIDFQELVSLSVANFSGKNWRCGQIMYDIENSSYVNAGLGFYFELPEFNLNYNGDRTDIAPSPRMLWVLQKWAEMVGFGVEGDFFSRPDFQELCFYNAYVLKVLHPITYANYYVSTPRIEYKYMMPEWTFEEFISELSKVFNLEIDFDIFTRKMTINLQDEFNFGYITGTELKLSNDYSIHSTNAKKVVLKYELDKSDKYASTSINKGLIDLSSIGILSDDILLESYPSQSIIGTNENDYEVISSKMMPVRIREGSGIYQGSFTLYYVRTPVCGLLPNEKGNNSVRLFFYKEKVTIDFRNEFVSLAFNELAYGIAKFWKETINNIENNYEVELSLPISTKEAIELIQNKKVFVDGVFFKLKKINLKLPIKTSSKIVLNFH